MKHSTMIGTLRQALRSLPGTVKLSVLLILLTCATTSAHAQMVDGRGGVFSTFKSKVLPIMNALVGIACLFGIGKGALDLMGGNEHGKRNLVWVVIGGLIWTAASLIINALS